MPENLTCLKIFPDEIIGLKSQNPSADTTTLEVQIDQLVYQLYDLTEEEIAIIENAS